MTNIDLQKEHARATAKLNQLKGRLDAAKSRLKDEFGFDDLASAQEALAAMEMDLASKQEPYYAKYAEFIAAWGDKLGTL